MQIVLEVAAFGLDASTKICGRHSVFTQ